MTSIRIARETDLAEIDAIYNQAIDSQFTADTVPLKVDVRKIWLNEHHPDEHPVFVAVENHKITGWLSISPYRKGRLALAETVEISYYIDKNYFRRGIGSKLLLHAIEFAKNKSYRNLIAIVLESNEASIKILEKHNFKRWGFIPEAANFHGNITGHIYFGKQIQKTQIK